MTNKSCRFLAGYSLGYIIGLMLLVSMSIQLISQAHAASPKEENLQNFLSSFDATNPAGQEIDANGIREQFSGPLKARVNNLDNTTLKNFIAHMEAKGIPLKEVVAYAPDTFDTAFQAFSARAETPTAAEASSVPNPGGIIPEKMTHGSLSSNLTNFLSASSPTMALNARRVIANYPKRKDSPKKENTKSVDTTQTAEKYLQNIKGQLASSEDITLQSCEMLPYFVRNCEPFQCVDRSNAEGTITTELYGTGKDKQCYFSRIHKDNNLNVQATIDCVFGNESRDTYSKGLEQLIARQYNVDAVQNSYEYRQYVKTMENHCFADNEKREYMALNELDSLDAFHPALTYLDLEGEGGTEIANINIDDSSEMSDSPPPAPDNTTEPQPVQTAESSETVTTEDSTSTTETASAGELDILDILDEQPAQSLTTSPPKKQPEDEPLAQSDENLTDNYSETLEDLEALEKERKELLKKSVLNDADRAYLALLEQQIKFIPAQKKLSDRTQEALKGVEESFINNRIDDYEAKQNALGEDDEYVYINRGDRLENEASAPRAEKDMTVTLVDEQGNAIDAGEEEEEIIPTNRVAGATIEIREFGADAKNIDVQSKLNEGYRALIVGQTSAAISIYRAILKVENENKNALFGLATAYHRNHQVIQARETYTRILTLDPNHKDALNNFLVLVAEESPENALYELQRLERINPEFSPIPAQIAMVYLKTGDADKAERYLKRALSLSPDNVVYKYNLAITLDQMDEVEQAIIFYRDVIEEIKSGAVIPGSFESVVERLSYLENSR